MFLFFLSCSGAAVYTARMRPREGSCSNFLTPGVAENVMEKSDTLKREWYVSDICSHFVGFCSQMHISLIYWHPQNSVLQLHKMMSVALCCVL